MSIRLASATQLSVILSFKNGTALDARLLSSDNPNADSVMALRAALNTPLVITGAPDVLISSIDKALLDVREAMVGASAVYSGLDMAAVLASASAKVAAASKNAPKAKEKEAKASTPKVAQSAQVVGSDDDDEDFAEEQAVDDQTPEPVSITTPTQSSAFAAFDSL
jgi:hypothetical protein